MTRTPSVNNSTENRMTNNKITVNAHAFADLLRDVRPFASRDDTLPMLHGVALHTATSPAGGDVLVAGATDRYVLMQGFISASGQVDGQVLLPLGGISTIRRVLRDAQPSDLATIIIGEIAVEVGRESATERASVTVAVDRFTFPDIGKLVVDAKKADVTSELPVLDPHKLAAFAKVARRHRYPFPGMRLRSTGPTAATVVQIGQHLIGLVMPMRPDERLTVDVPAFSTASVEVEPEQVPA